MKNAIQQSTKDAINLRMENAIKEIIKKIPKGKVFDSHLVIDQLIAKHSNEYLDFAGLVATSPKKTAVVHGLIGRKIKIFRGSLIEQVPGKIFSETIHRKGGDCAKWKKIK